MPVSQWASLDPPSPPTTWLYSVKYRTSLMVMKLTRPSASSFLALSSTRFSWCSSACRAPTARGVRTYFSYSEHCKKLHPVPFWRERWCLRRGCTWPTPPWLSRRPRGRTPLAWLPPPAPGSHDSPLPDKQQGGFSKRNVSLLNVWECAQFFLNVDSYWSQYILLPFPCKITVEIRVENKYHSGQNIKTSCNSFERWYKVYNTDCTSTS